ncbi:MAG TPA: hypothetical protein DCF33_07290, partial [Saprospirales bacterium]|nr:hypothetical protein [Saprospirales bacterium]
MRFFLFSLVFWTVTHQTFAQLPPVCQGSNPPLAKTCSGACILCQLDGYASTTTQTTQGQIIPGYCTQVVHSMGYIGFVAGSTDLTIEVTVGNCTLGNSIEMGIYATDDCQQFTLVSDCNTAMFSGNTYSFTNTEPLHPGCPYFLAFDNNGPAACAFTVAVVSGDASAPQVGQPQTPVGPNALCPGATAVYTIPPINGACHYRWTAPPGTTINGMASPVDLNHDEGTSVTVTWGNQGGQLCVSGSNPCNSGPTACLPVTIAPIPPTVLPLVRICNGESYEWLDGNPYSNTQLLTYTYVTPLGCDSVVQQQLIVPPPIISQLGVLRICPGTCVQVGNNPYCMPGSYSELLTSEKGCDSTLLFSIAVLPVDAMVNTPDTISCLQDTILLDGTGSIGDQYAWYNGAWSNFSTDTMTMVKDTGWYALIITRMVAGLTCRDTARVFVPGNLAFPVVSTSGDTMTCVQPQAQIAVTPISPDVTYSWTGPGGFSSPVPDTVVSLPGLYFLSATSLNGCTALDTALVYSDTVKPVLMGTPPDTLTCILDSVFLQTTVQPNGAGLLWSGPQNFNAALDTVLVSLPGPYTLVATASNGCKDTLVLTVAIDTLSPNASASGGIISCAMPSAILSGQVSPSGATATWSGPNGFNAGVADTVVSFPGQYILTATAMNGCTNVATVTVPSDTLPPLLTIAGAGALTCATDTILVTATPSPSGSALTWGGPSGFFFSGSAAAIGAPGTYTVTATAPNGCTTIQSFVIGANNTPPTVTATGGTLTCFQTSLTLMATISPAGSSVVWSGPGNFSSSLLTPSVSTPGMYTITATAPNGCTATATATVQADASIPLVSASGGVLTCTQTSILLNGSVTPANTPVSWSGPAGFSSSQLNPAVSIAGTYTMTATNASGCTAVATVMVGIDTVSPQVTVSGGTITCAQPQVQLSSNVPPPGAMLQWFGPQGFTSSSPNPTINLAGPYLLTVTLPNGCSGQATAIVLADVAPPVLTLTGGVMTCSQPAIFLQASISPAGSTVQWTGPSGFISSQPNPTVSVPGLYVATATAANGCTATASILAGSDTQPPVVSATGNTITCAVPVVNIQATVSQGIGLLWSGPQNFSSTNPSPSVTLPGSYSVTATGANGCTAQAGVMVGIDTVAPQVMVSGGLLTCTQPQLVLAAVVQPPNAAILWSGPQSFSSTLLQPSVTVAGTYTLTATGLNGCTGTDQALVTADAGFPQVSVTGGTLTCSQPSLTLISSISPSSSTVSWSGPQNFSSNLPQPSVSIPGTYTITVTTSSGCTATSQATVSIDTIPPQVTALGATITCAIPQVSLSANVIPAGSPVVWSGPNGFTSAILNPQTSLAGVYGIVATTPNGCTTSATTTVLSDLAPPQITASGGILTCLQPGITLTSSVSPAGSTLHWTGPQNFSSTLLNPPTNTPGTYILTATAPNGCMATASAIVSSDVNIPQTAAFGGTINCLQAQIQLFATVTPSGFTVSWTGPQGFSSSAANPTVSYPGVYLLTATLPNGCSATATATVTADTLRPAVSATGGDLTCLAETVALSAVTVPAGIPVAWNGPSGFTSTQAMPIVLQEGVYSVQALAPNGCTATTQTTVTAHNQAAWTLSLGPDLYVESMERVFPEIETDLPIGQISRVQWIFPAGVQGSPCDTCLKPVIRPTTSGDLAVEVPDLYGCSL